MQEQANNNWTNRGPSIFSTPTAVVNAPQARFRFTGFSIPARDAEHFYGADGGVDFAVPFIDCQFEGGSFYSTRPQVYVTNCLFQGVAVTLESGETGFNAAFRHNTFHGGTNYLFQMRKQRELGTPTRRWIRTGNGLVFEKAPEDRRSPKR